MGWIGYHQMASAGRVYGSRIGAFVEILPGRDGLCHISELSTGFVNSVFDVCQVGDEMKVIVIDVDAHDRVKLSRRQALQELGIVDEFANRTAEGGGEGGGERPPRRPDEGNRDSRGGDRGGGDRGRGGGGRGRR